jgi:hypothetical protein
LVAQLRAGLGADRVVMQRRLFTWLPALLAGLVAFTLVLTVTDPPGPGLDPDALQYLGAAASVAASGEYNVPMAAWASADSTEPLTHFPPGYPTALAVPVRLGMEPAQAARLVDATAAFVMFSTVVLLVGMATSPIAGTAFGIALFGMTSMYTAHASVLSEPLYLACMMLVLAAMVFAPDRPLRAGIPAAVAVMTRYAGLSIVGAIALWALAQPGRWTDRMRRAAIAVAPAVALQGIWVLRTRAVAQMTDIRKIAIYGNWAKSLAQSGLTFMTWLVPDPATDTEPLAHRALLAVAAFVALATLTAIGLWHMRRMASNAGKEKPFAPRLVQAAALLLVCYAGLLGASRLFADPGIPFDERIFAPALLSLMILGAIGLAFWWRGTRLVVARVAVAVALLSWWYAGVSVIRTSAHFAMTWGSDFAGQQWHDSQVLAWARREGTHGPLYSNWPAAVFFYLHRPSHELPILKEARNLKAFGDTVRARGGHVLLFNAKSVDYVANALLIRNSGLDILDELSDGWILGADH